MKALLFFGAVVAVLFTVQPSHAMEDYYRYIEKYHEEKQDFLALKQRAMQGDAEAQLALAEMYFEGHPPGVPRSAKKALEWYEKAAENGNAEAQHKTGLLYMGGMEAILGPNMKSDEKKAREYFEKAAEGGYKDAQKVLAGMYATGEQLYDKKDLVEAYKWAVLASEQIQDDVDAEEKEDDQDLINATTWLESQLTEAELKKAKRLIQRYQTEKGQGAASGGYGAYGRSKYAN